MNVKKCRLIKWSILRIYLHHRTRPKSKGGECHCHISKWSEKNCVLSGLLCPAVRAPDRPLGWRQQPGTLKGCGVKNNVFSDQIWRQICTFSMSTTNTYENMHAIDNVKSYRKKSYVYESPIMCENIILISDWNLILPTKTRQAAINDLSFHSALFSQHS